MTISKASAIRSVLRQGDFITAPGVFDLISAKIADQLGFPALYMTGYGTVASHLGLPDAGLATYTDMVERNGLRMNISGRHRALQTYFAALEGAGLVVDRLVEVPAHPDAPGSRWRRVPLFLHLRARHAAPR